MNITASPFLVGRNRNLGYQVILMPSFLQDKTLHYILLQIAKGDVSAPKSAIYREIRGISVGHLGVIFRVIMATEKSYGLGQGDVLDDAFNRPIRLFEGLVIRDSIDPLSNLVLTQDDLLAAHRQAKVAYKAFWSENRSFTPWTSHPIQINTSINSVDQVKITVDAPLEISHFSDKQGPSNKQPGHSPRLTIAIAAILILMVLFTGVFIVMPIYNSIVSSSKPKVPNSSTLQVESPRTGGTLAYDPIHHISILFGGTMQVAGSPMTNQTWAWNGKAWKQLHPKSSPPALPGTMVYDAFSQNIVLFLNRSTSGGKIANEMWTWNGTIWRQLQPSVIPEVLDASIVYDEKYRQVVLFGGKILSGNHNTFMNTTWTWNGTTWRQQHPVTSPSPRSKAAMAYDAAHQQIVLYGGTTQNGASFETWIWNGTTWRQQVVSISPRYHNATLVYDNTIKKILLFGGHSSADEMFLWTGLAWTRLTTKGVPNVSNESVVYDGATQTIVVYAILRSAHKSTTSDSYGIVSQTWIWNGKVWRLLS